MAARIRKDDEVIVITGRDKGKRGKVLRVFPKLDRAIVQGINIALRHQKKRGLQDSGIIKKEATIHLSNLMLIDPSNGKPVKVGFRVLDDGRKVRFARGSNQLIEG